MVHLSPMILAYSVIFGAIAAQARIISACNFCWDFWLTLAPSSEDLSVSGHMSRSTYCRAVARMSGKARVYVLFLQTHLHRVEMM